MNSRNSAVSKYLDAKQNRRQQARYRQKRLRMGLPAAVPLKHVSLNQEEKKAIASTEAIGTAKQKQLFVTRHFGWPVSLGVHLLAAILLTLYAVQEYIPEPPPVFLDFVELPNKPRDIRTLTPIKPVKPADRVVIQAPRAPRSTPTAVEIPRETARFYTPTDDPIDTGDALNTGGVSIPKIGDIGVDQGRAEIPTEAPGVKIDRDTQFAPDDSDIGDIPDADLEDRPIDAEVEVQVDQRPRTLSTPDPKYPATARRAEREGLVELQFIVGVDGRASDITVIKEEPKGFGFGDAAIEAVKKRWRFVPAKKGGESVPMRVKIPIRFTLDD